MTAAPALEAAALPADAIEVGRILDAWGVQGWFKVLSYSPDADALSCARRWWLKWPDRAPAGRAGTTCLLRVQEVRAHAGGLVAHAPDVSDRAQAQALRGATVWLPRASFPTPDEGEYYWIDLIGCTVSNREGLVLGRVDQLMTTGPQTVMVLIDADAAGQPVERLIPFVAVYVDSVDVAQRRILVDWQPDY